LNLCVSMTTCTNIPAYGLRVGGWGSIFTPVCCTRGVETFEGTTSSGCGYDSAQRCRVVGFFVRCRQLGKAPCHSVAGCNSPLHALVAGSAELTDWLQTAPDEKLLVLPTHYWRSLSVKKLSLCANWTSFSGAIYDYFDMFVSI